MNKLKNARRGMQHVLSGPATGYSPHRRAFLQRSAATGFFAAGAASGILPFVSFMEDARAQTGYKESSVSNGGHIKGTISFSGTVPTKQLVPNDTEVCGDPRKDPQIHLGPNNGVQDAVVFIREISEGKPWPDLETPTLDNLDCRFVPQMLTMQPGPVKIVNSDPILHNTHIFYGRRTAVNIALPEKGLVVERELTRPGILRITCDEHGHMAGAGYVAANPYYSATGESGEYEITDVPPGEYTVIIYQRETGPVEQTVAVEAGETTDLSVDLA